MSGQPRSTPKRDDGTIDVEAVKAMFMSCPYLDWTRFAEEQGWDPFRTRQDFPVRIWLKEKRDYLTSNQMDILSGMIHERKFKWTKAVIKTLDDYPEFIDMGLNIAKAKLSQIADMYRDYTDNFKDKPDKQFHKFKSGRVVRVLHPFERLAGGEIGALLAGMKAITDAKLKALMLDKWAISKLDLPIEQEHSDDNDGGTRAGPIFTIEGKEVVDAKELQNWFDTFHDKPALPPAPPSGNQTSNEGEKIEPDDDGGS